MEHDGSQRQAASGRLWERQLTFGGTRSSRHWRGMGGCVMSLSKVTGDTCRLWIRGLGGGSGFSSRLRERVEHMRSEEDPSRGFFREALHDEVTCQMRMDIETGQE